MDSLQFDLILSLLQQMCLYLVIAYLLSKTPLFTPLMQVKIHLPHKLLCYVVFSIFCIMGTYFGLPTDDVIVNTRATGAVLGGVLGGPVVGFFVGLTGGLHRYSLGGISATACMVSTIVEGLIGGLLHRDLLRRHRMDLLLQPLTVGATTLFAEILQMLIILLLVQPFSQALYLVNKIALPMMIANTVGAAMFMRILLDRRAIFEKYTTAFSTKALNIAARSAGVLRQGFNQESSQHIAKIIYEELGVGAVAITDRETLLAFIGMGADHHVPGTRIISHYTHQAIETNQVVYADGNEIRYACLVSPNCKLGSTLVIPLRGVEQSVIGTIKLYEPKSRLFSSVNRTLGEGIAHLLSVQLLTDTLNQQKQLLSQSEIKLLHAQVNPHFLFNALNTLSAVIRKDPAHARCLVLSLSTFFRKNLKRSNDEVSLSEEMEHVNAYLEIEKARFAERLTVEIAIPEELLMFTLPAFSLQPIVENAIKHGTSQMLAQGHIRIQAAMDLTESRQPVLALSVEDNAGLYQTKFGGDGLGMNLVDRRIKNRYGYEFGLSVDSVPEQFTRVVIRLPIETKI